MSTTEPTHNITDQITVRIYQRCYGYWYYWQKCSFCIEHPSGTKCFPSSSLFGTDNDFLPSYGSRPYQKEYTTTTTPYPTFSEQTRNTNYNYDTLNWWVVNVLLPVAMVLIGICFVLGVILIIKSYMMTSIKQNPAVAIRRRRRTGHAPDNQYIAPAEMRASIISCSDRKSFPPPEVLLAARERASQLYTV